MIVYTGDGKGKTTAAIGLAVRAWGNGMRILILQFIKGEYPSGERAALESLGQRIRLRTCGMGFLPDGHDDNMRQHQQAAKVALQLARREALSGQWDMIVLDEINYAVKYHLLSENEVLQFITDKPAELHVVLTGRDAQPAVLQIADLVTEMRLVKHPWQQGIPAQKGIEF